MRSLRKIFLAIGALLIAGGGFLLYQRRSADSESLPKTPAERVALLDSGLHAIEDGDRNAPRDRWDPHYVQQQVGSNPDSLLAWVRDHTVWIPYSGTLRGPVGVLMDRRGNSLDRALLLAALLRSAGLSPRLAVNQLPAEVGRQLLPQMVAAAHTITTLQAAPSLSLTASQYGLNSKLIQSGLDRQKEGVRQLYSTLQSRVSAQMSDLQRRVQPRNADDEWDDRADAALSALRDHWWIVVDINGDQRSLDPMDLTELTPSASYEPASIPDSLQHSLAIRVIAERWLNGEVSTSKVLDQSVVPSQLQGQELVLQFWPKHWPKQIDPNANAELGLKGQALAQTEWSAALVAGTNILAQSAFDSHAESKRMGGSPFGAMGAAIGAIASGPKPEDAGQMTAVWIEYEIKTPNAPPRIMRRTVFDFFGATARGNKDFASLNIDERKRLTRSLALMMRTEILPVTSRVAPDFVAHLAAQSLLANQKTLHTLASNWSQIEQIDEDSLMENASAPLSPLYTLAVARQEWSRFRDATFINQINLITRHHHAGLMGNNFGIRGSIEILAGDVGVALSERNAFPIRQYQGILDTNADALWWTGEGLNNTSEAFTSSSPGSWRTLSSTNSSELARLQLPDDPRTQIKSDIESGLVVVAPASPVSRGPDNFVGWWRIDPATGRTEGIAANGWGQCGAEEASLTNMATEAIKSFAYEYALCHGIAQSINASRGVALELKKRNLWFWWVEDKNLQSGEMKEVFDQANKGCLIGAMMGGFLATMPILLFRAEQISMELALEQKVQNTKKFAKSGATKPSFEIPEGANPKAKGNPKGFDPGDFVSEAPKGETEPITKENSTKPKPPGEPPEPVTEPSPTKMPPTEPAPTEPAPTKMPHTEPAPTEPAPTEVAPTEKAPSKTTPGEAPRTEPQLTPPDFDPVEPTPKPQTLEEARAQEIEAGRRLNELDGKSVEALTEAVQYRQYKPQPARNWPGEPAKWDPQVDADNFAKYKALHDEEIRAQQAYNAAKKATQDMVAAQRGAQGRGGFPPPRPAAEPARGLPGCPPNCGNNNPTGSASPVNAGGSSEPLPSSNNIAVGSSAISSSIPFPLIRRP